MEKSLFERIYSCYYRSEIFSWPADLLFLVHSFKGAKLVYQGLADAEIFLHLPLVLF